MVDEPRRWLMDGPFREDQPTGQFDRYLTPQKAIHIPLDESLELTDGAPFAHAIYWRTGLENGLEYMYHFHRIRRIDRQQFSVRFIGGPLNGVRQFHQPAMALRGVVFLPLRANRLTATDDCAFLRSITAMAITLNTIRLTGK